MTIGSPDFQSYPTWQATQIEDNTITVPVGASPQGIIAVSNFASLYVSLIPNADFVTGQVSYYADQAGTKVITVFTLNCDDHASVAVILPNLGPFAQLTLNNGGGANAAVTVTVAPVNIPVTQPAYVIAGNNIMTGSVSIPASGSGTFHLPQVAPGEAWWAFEPLDNSGKLNFQIQVGLGLGGSGTIILRKTGPTAEIDGLIELSDLPYDMVITNTDATAAHSFRLTVNAPGTG